MWTVGAIEADDVVVLVLHPHSANEAPVAGVGLGLNVNDQAAHLADEFTADKGEVVVFLLQVLIEDNHLREAEREELHLIEAGQMIHHALAERRGADEGT